MMKPFGTEHIDFLRNKFNNLAGSFLSGDKICNDHIELKRAHTLRVCDEMVLLSKQTGLSDEDVSIAYIIALYHDAGRFEQFCKYRTFDDSQSLDHAVLSVETIKSNGFLDYIPDSYHPLIFKTILNHNKPFPDFSNDDETTMFSKLLRDADKLDIWNVITTDELREVIEQGDNDTDYEVPENIFQRYVNREIVTHNMVSCDNDMRLLRISWVFDINFIQTYREIKKRRVLDKIFQLIPESVRKNELKVIADNFIEEKTR